MIFAVNQVNHVYVANKLATKKVTSSDSLGTIRPVCNDGHLYFEYNGYSLMRSDLIKVDNIKWATATKASALSKKLKSVTVSLKSNPVAG